MKQAVIVAHPDVDSFTLTMARAWCGAATSAGHKVELRDLYRIGFDPRLQDQEIPRPTGFSPGVDVLAERALIGDAEVFVFVYPLWFYAPPAMLKGYIDRVFGMGFGYGPQQHGGNQRLLGGRKMLSFSSSGAPSNWVESQGDLAAIRRLFDDHIAAVCGMTVLDHVHFGGVVPNLVSNAVRSHEQQVRDIFTRHFVSIQ